jgi:hypothetical protein
MQRMEREMENLRRDMKAIEEDYGTNAVRLIVTNGYVARLLENDQVASYPESFTTLSGFHVSKRYWPG